MRARELRSAQYGSRTSACSRLCAQAAACCDRDSVSLPAGGHNPRSLSPCMLSGWCILHTHAPCNSHIYQPLLAKTQCVVR